MNTKTKTLLPSFILVLAMLLLPACNGIPLITAGNVNAGAQPQVATLPAVPDTSNQTQPQAPSPTISGQTGVVAAYEGTLQDIYTRVNPSVVNIHVVSEATASADPFSQLPGFNSPQGNTPQVQEALGSGFVWDTQGHIITNNHVVAGAQKIDVTFSDGTTVPAKLVGADPDSDLAVIQVTASSDLLQPVTLADSTQVKVGQLAIALGNPFGLENTMTVGIISALGRSLPAGENSATTTGPTYTIPDIIQTDAPINPGNSGGVLLDADGQVVGVTAAIESPSQANAGIGFVIPSQIVGKVVPVLISDGKYVHPWLGISGASLNPDLAAAMHLDANQRGVLVATVTAGSPSDKAGLQPSNDQATINGQQVPVGGDVITAVDGQPTNKIDDLIAYLAANTEVGQKVELTILRNGKEQKLEVTLAARPTDNAQQQASAQTSSAPVYLGIKAIPLDAGLITALQLPINAQGLLIQSIETGSPADEAGLKPSTQDMLVNGKLEKVGGDILVAVDANPVSSLEELQAVLGQYNAGDTATLTIVRNGRALSVDVTLAAKPL